MKTYRGVYITLLLSAFLCLKGFSQQGFFSRLLTDNTKPKNGMIGFSVEGILVNTKNGEIFVDSIPDAPHGEFGVGIGVDYWKKYINHFDLHIGIEAKYNHYHFHKSWGTNLEEHDGWMRHLYLSVPFSINFPLNNYPYLFIIGGISLNTVNLMPIKRGNINGQNYDARITSNWPVYPGFHVGLNIFEEKNKFAHYRFQVTYSVAPFRNLGYDANIYYDTFVENASGIVKTGRAEFKFIIYPHWKKNLNGQAGCIQ